MIGLNPIMAKVKPSATLAINELSAKLISEGKEVFRLGFGQSPFPVPNKVVEALKKNAFQKDYLPVQGLKPLREEISSFFRRRYGLSIEAEEVFIGPGSKELIYNFQVSCAFDELLLPIPSWVSYEPQAILTGHKVVWLPTKKVNGWKLDAKALEEHCKKDPDQKRAIILNYPSNPLGNTYSDEELQALAEVVRKKQIIVIADEIYGEVHHEGLHQTIAKYYPEGTIISTGLSKWAGAGGWRFGVFVFPPQLKYLQNAMAIVASETFTSVSAPIQYAAVEAYKEDESLKLYLENTRKILKAVGLYVYNELTTIGISMPKPEGGFYLYPNFEKWRPYLISMGLTNSEDFCSHLLSETGVALLPGMAFGHPNDNFAARLSYVDFDGEKILEYVMENPEISIDRGFVENYCPRIILAIKQIITWTLSLEKIQ